jgi:flagellin
LLHQLEVGRYWCDGLPDDDGTTIQFRATADAKGCCGWCVGDYHWCNGAFTAITTAEGKGIDKVDITTQATAWEALQRIDSAIDKVNKPCRSGGYSDPF